MMKIRHFYKLFSNAHGYKEGILQMHVILYTSYKFYKKYNYMHLGRTLEAKHIQDLQQYFVYEDKQWLHTSDKCIDINSVT